jgi:hypothetical protein
MLALAGWRQRSPEPMDGIDVRRAQIAALVDDDLVPRVTA